MGFRGWICQRYWWKAWLQADQPGGCPIICARVKSHVFWGGMVIPHRESLCWVYKPYYWVYKPYYWVDDHPLLYGNNRSLDLSTYINFNTFLFCSFAILQNIHHAFSTEVLRCSAVGMCRDAYLEVTAASTWRLLAVRVAGSRWLSVVDGRCTLFPSREGTPPQDATGEETASWNYKTLKISEKLNEL